MDSKPHVMRFVRQFEKTNVMAHMEIEPENFQLLVGLENRDLNQIS